MIMAKLKTATQPYHERIEHDLNLLRPHFTSGDYRDYLYRTYGFYKPWEQSIADIAAQYSHLQAWWQPKLPLVKQDLCNLGYTEHMHALPQCAMEITTLPQALGSLYVMEGATLGSQIIVKHMKKTLETAVDSYHFLEGYGKETGPRWKAFGQYMDGLVTEAMEQEVTDSACRTFSCLGDWYASSKAHP